MIREGQMWYYEVSELFSKFYDVNKIAYCGFERVNDRYGCHTAGIFEFPIDFKFTEEAEHELLGYTSDRISYVVHMNKINRYRNCVIVVLK